MHVKAIIRVLAASFIMVLEAQPVHAQFIYRQQAARPLFSRDTLSICMLGDMMMHSAQISDAQKHGFDSYFMHLKDKISSADIAVANMEFTLAGEPYTGYPAFSAPDEYAEYLAECGFDIFLCANNHIYDKGSRGAERTLEKFRELGLRYGIKYCGLASDEVEKAETTPLFITAKGIRTAIINFTYGTNLGADRHWPNVNYMSDRAALEKALHASCKSDFTLVVPHWGNEYELTHSPGQQETARWLIENGADMIIGTHPHVVQDCEFIDGIQTAYSLGNAVSNMSAANTQIGLMATIQIVRDTDGDISILPLEFTWLWCSRPGGYNDSYTVLPVTEFINRKQEWKGLWEYEKMVTTYERVRKATGIK